MTAQYFVGDVFDRLAELEDGSVDLVVTSPPFLALRSYLPADHPDKAKEIGQEQSPAEFIDVLLRVTQELRRVLAPHGSLCVELGDTNAGSGGAGGDYQEEGLRAGQPVFDGSARRNAEKTSSRRDRATVAPREWTHGPGWPLAKSRCLIPESYRWALVYGINPFTGDESPAGEWIARNIVTWCKRNPAPGYIGDRWRYGTSDILVACTSPNRYWDDLATRQPHSPNTHRRNAAGVESRPNTTPSGQRDGHWDTLAITDEQNPFGAPLLDWWDITPKGYPGAHYAVYSADIVIPLVKAMCPERVCRICGKPSERIIEARQLDTGRTTNGPQSIDRRHIEGGSPGFVTRTISERIGIGWTDCGHDDWRPGITLDPFAGTGTTLHVAEALGRDSIGIDIDERNRELFEVRAEEPAFMRLRQGDLLSFIE